MDPVQQPKPDGQSTRVPRRPRSRVRARDRRQRVVDTTNAAALVAWAYTLRPIVTSIRAMAEDATAPPRHRVHSRVYLRATILGHIRELEARIDAVARAQLSTPLSPEALANGGAA
jgi:hypothetical protein